jgi:hypothetical protein
MLVSWLVRALSVRRVCDQLTAIALHADSVSMERPIHGATPKPCRERLLDNRVEDPQTTIQHSGIRTPDMAPTRDHLIQKGVSRHVCVRLSPRSAAIRRRSRTCYRAASKSPDRRKCHSRPESYTGETSCSARRIPRSGVPHGRCPRRLRASLRSLYAARSASSSIRCGAGRWVHMLRITDGVP